MVLWAVTSASPVAAADGRDSALEDLYVKKDTWQETLLCFRTALHKNGKEKKPVVPLPAMGSDGFTVAAWIRTEEGGTIFACSPVEGGWVSQGKTFFVRGGVTCFDIGWVGVVTSKREVADGEWHHVAVTGRDHAIRIYIDGDMEASGTLHCEPRVAGHLFKVGFTNPDFPGPSGFTGLIDEVMVFACRLSDKEVASCFQSRAHGGDRALAAYWPFDGDASDASGNGNRAMSLVHASFTRGRKGGALRLDGSGYALFPPGDGSGIEEALWEQLRRDFPDFRSIEEMEWEREDGIWIRSWRPGDWAELASRYSEASFRSGRLAEEAEIAAQRVIDRAGVAGIRDIYYRTRRFGSAMERIGELKPESLRKAIKQLMCDHGSGYPRAGLFLARLDEIEDRVLQWETGDALLEEVEGVENGLRRLRTEALLDHNPLMNFSRIIFVKRHTYQSSHYYTDYIDGPRHYGGNICILDLASGEVTDVVPELEGGIFGRFDISWDCERIVFDYKAAPREGFRIYETRVDGTGLRRLTFPPPDEEARIKKYDNSDRGGTGKIYFHQTDDMHPCYLPDGGICFVPTRCERGILCDGPDILTTTTLYRMDKDGGNMRLLSMSPVSEEVPSVMNDGRILYTRWEYVDKGGSAVKCLWAMRPDGTGSVEIFGNDHAFPSFYNGRAVPGHNNLFVCIGGPHMPLGVGTVLRLDINRPIRTREPMTYITPGIDIQTEWGYRHMVDGEWKEVQEGPLFDDPYPLSERFFLVAYNADSHVHDTVAYDICLLDEFGNRTLIHDDPEISCWQPMPLRPRPKPPVIPALAGNASQEKPPSSQAATVFLSDVYEGLEGVARGEIKYLRIMETVARPWSARRFWDGDEHGQQHSVVSLWTHTHVKVLHGVVPVDEDGSAHFTVPADRNIFFQALDAEFMEVQRMRTFVDFMPGESRSCIGCHELRNRAPKNRSATALLRCADEPAPQPGDDGPRAVHYSTDVQPILDRHCVRCHGGSEPEAGMDLSEEMTSLFCRSYENIVNRNLVKAVSEIRYKMGNVDETAPYTWGSHASGLVSKIRNGHSKVNLSREEFIRLVTWVDANAPYYGSYFGRKNLIYKDHPDFRPIPTFESASGFAPR